MPRSLRTYWLPGLALLALAWCVAAHLVGEDAQPKETDSADKDYAAELPRIPAQDPAEALKSFQTVAGFKMELVASEPQVTDPIAISIDENLRMYVVEMRGYSENRDDNLSRIRLLDDKDGDGKYESSKVFVEKLKWPTAITCWNGGILVADAPDIHWYKDTTGDDQPDEHQVLFTGFGLSNVQGLINSFNWGLDNRFYCSTSSTGGEVTKPGDASFQPLPLRGRDFALEPRAMAMAAVSGGAQHGLSFDDWGNRFVCHNSDHIMQIMYEDQYLARNPYLAAPSPKKSIAVDGPQADVFRISQIEPWRIVRTRLRVKGIVPGIVEGGGRPGGYFTSATGITIYRGNAWPAELLGTAIVGDVGSNIIHRKQVDESGIEFKATRMDEKKEFVASSDNWFRPVQFANAPDGTMYVCDMYRETIEHPASIPPVIKKHVDLTSGRDRGRIWRIAPEDFSYPKLEKLGNKSTEQLIAYLEHPNGWQRDTAARLLYERQDRKGGAALEKIATASKLPQGRIHALYALAGMDALDAEIILVALADEDAHVRQHAVRLAERVVGDSSALRNLLTQKLISDKSIHVRYQLAFSLGEVPANVPSRSSALAALVHRDGSDANMRIAILSSLREGAGKLLVALLQDKALVAKPEGRDLLKSLGAQIGKQQSAEDVTDLLQMVATLEKVDSATLQAIVEGVAAKPGSDLAAKLADVTGGKAAEVMKALFTSALSAAADEKLSPAQRAAAIEQLRVGAFADSAELLASLVDPAQPAELQGTALSTLASYENPEVAQLLIERFAAMSPRLKSRAADILLSRAIWIDALLSAIAKGDIPLGDLDPARLKLLSDHPDAAIQAKAKGVLAKLQVSKRGDVLEAYKSVLETKGDVARGKEAFKKTCAACHKVQGVGHDIGPNLATMRNRGAEAILLNVLDPNREVNPQYLTYIVQLTDGRTLNGMIVAETATSLTLKRAENATDTVLRIDIERLKSTGQSLMLEGLEKQVDKQSMADLLEYLKTLE